ncbi:MAG: BMP family protein [Actinomycetota bacterium]|mgnify:FL=1|nr:BMP family ABC transporter substrate-binding protein [Acidimicrobiaceae bacterium]MEC6988408.1 BMP family protein [Actinomycetota bacterium]MEC7175326.1 BMP family protein [Actinomycetota bacterium]MEC7457623.1 BMP family protein [Actinomycetota bacterium]MEC7580292.1 BMP family protein [Actinomycetota bacterium]
MTSTTGRRTRRALVALLGISSLVLAACGGSDDSSTEEPAAEPAAAEEPAEASADPVRIALVAPSAINDLAFTQSMYDSVQRVADNRDVTLDVSDGLFIVEDAGAALRGYAEDGYDLVIAHGTQFGGPLEEIAPDFPEVSFMWGTSTDFKGLDNIYAYSVRSDHGGYVNGTIAAQITESGTVGVVGPVEAGDAKLYVDGFVAGAAAQNPDVVVNVNYIESFSDVALAAEAATSHIASGADVLTGTAQMVVGATGVAQAEGVPWFGTQSNQTALGEDIVVASQVYHWEVIIEPILDQIANGTLGGEVFELTLANGGLVIEFNDAFGLDSAIQSAAEETVAGLTSGEVSTGL